MTGRRGPSTRRLPVRWWRSTRASSRGSRRGAGSSQAAENCSRRVEGRCPPRSRGTAAGRTRWLEPDEIEPARERGDIAEAFQSYPVLLDRDGDVPPALTDERLGVDVNHRDGRLAIGTLADGRLLIALTRFNGLGPLSPPVPLGLTLADMAAVMRGLGCRRALALDGGVSAQLMVRDNGDRIVWRGWRKVPLGLVAVPVREE